MLNTEGIEVDESTFLDRKPLNNVRVSYTKFWVVNVLQPPSEINYLNAFSTFLQHCKETNRRRTSCVCVNKSELKIRNKLLAMTLSSLSRREHSSFEQVN